MLFRTMLVFALSAFAVIGSSAADEAKKVPDDTKKLL